MIPLEDENDLLDVNKETPKAPDAPKAKSLDEIDFSLNEKGHYSKDALDFYNRDTKDMDIEEQMKWAEMRDHFKDTMPGRESPKTPEPDKYDINDPDILSKLGKESRKGRHKSFDEYASWQYMAETGKEIDMHDTSGSLLLLGGSIRRFRDQKDNEIAGRIAAGEKLADFGTGTRLTRYHDFASLSSESQDVYLKKSPELYKAVKQWEQQADDEGLSSSMGNNAFHKLRTAFAQDKAREIMGNRQRVREYASSQLEDTPWSIGRTIGLGIPTASYSSEFAISRAAGVILGGTPLGMVTQFIGPMVGATLVKYSEMMTPVFDVEGNMVTSADDPTTAFRKGVVHGSWETSTEMIGGEIFAWGMGKVLKPLTGPAKDFLMRISSSSTGGATAKGVRALGKIIGSASAVNRYTAWAGWIPEMFEETIQQPVEEAFAIRDADMEGTAFDRLWNSLENFKWLETAEGFVLNEAIHRLTGLVGGARQHRLNENAVRKNLKALGMNSVAVDLMSTEQVFGVHDATFRGDAGATLVAIMEDAGERITAEANRVANLLNTDELSKTKDAEQEKETGEKITLPQGKEANVDIAWEKLSEGAESATTEDGSVEIVNLEKQRKQQEEAKAETEKILDEIVEEGDPGSFIPGIGITIEEFLDTAELADAIKGAREKEREEREKNPYIIKDKRPGFIVRDSEGHFPTIYAPNEALARKASEKMHRLTQARSQIMEQRAQVAQNFAPYTMAKDTNVIFVDNDQDAKRVIQDNLAFSNKDGIALRWAPGAPGLTSPDKKNVIINLGAIRDIDTLVHTMKHEGMHTLDVGWTRADLDNFAQKMKLKNEDGSQMTADTLIENMKKYREKRGFPLTDEAVIISEILAEFQESSYGLVEQTLFGDWLKGVLINMKKSDGTKMTPEEKRLIQARLLEMDHKSIKIDNQMRYAFRQPVDEQIAQEEGVSDGEIGTKKAEQGEQADEISREQKPDQAQTPEATEVPSTPETSKDLDVRQAEINKIKSADDLTPEMLDLLGDKYTNDEIMEMDGAQLRQVLQEAQVAPVEAEEEIKAEEETPAEEPEIAPSPEQKVEKEPEVEIEEPEVVPLGGEEEAKKEIVPEAGEKVEEAEKPAEKESIPAPESVEDKKGIKTPEEKEAPVEAPEVVSDEAEIEPESDLFGEPAPLDKKDTGKAREFLEKLYAEYPSQEVPIRKIKVNERIKQFKGRADAKTGIVEGEALEMPIFGLNVSPIVLMEFNDGHLEVVTGRHRLGLYKFNKRFVIPARVIKESEGWTIGEARMVDALSNILDNQGGIDDYAGFFKATDLTRAEAEHLGLLRKPKGVAAFEFAQGATEGLWNLVDWQGKGEEGTLEIKRAVAIANAIPNVLENAEALQLGAAKMAMARRSTIEETGENAAILLRRMQSGEIKMPKQKTLWEAMGMDEGIFDDIDAEGRAISKKKRELRRAIGILDVAFRKDEALRLTDEEASKYGIKDKRDKEQIKAAIDTLTTELTTWAFPTREQINQARREAGLSVEEPAPVEQKKEDLSLEQLTPEQDKAEREKLAEQAQKREDKKKIEEGLRAPIEGGIGDTTGIIPGMENQVDDDLELFTERPAKKQEVVSTLQDDVTLTAPLNKGADPRAVVEGYANAVGAKAVIMKRDTVNNEPVKVFSFNVPKKGIQTVLLRADSRFELPSDINLDTWHEVASGVAPVKQEAKIEEKQESKATTKKTAFNHEIYNETAKEYGFSVTPEGELYKGEKKMPVKLLERGARLRVEAESDRRLIYSGPKRGESLGKFLEGYWKSKKIAPKAPAERKQRPDTISVTMDYSNPSAENLEAMIETLEQNIDVEKGLKLDFKNGQYQFSGETFANKDRLKRLGAQWHGRNKVWQMTPSVMQEVMEKLGLEATREVNRIDYNINKAMLNEKVDQSLANEISADLGDALNDIFGESNSDAMFMLADDNRMFGVMRLGLAEANNFLKSGKFSYEDFVKAMDGKFKNPKARRFYASWYNNAVLANQKLADKATPLERVTRFGKDGKPLAVAPRYKHDGKKPNSLTINEELIPNHEEYINNKAYAKATGFTLDNDQTAGVNLMLGALLSGEKVGFVLGDGPGFGKTAQLLAVADQFKQHNPNAKILIVSENQTILKTRFGGDAQAMGIDSKQFEYSTYSSLKKLNQQGKTEWDLILYDEAHNLKNAEAQKTAAAAGLKSLRKVYATATPMDRPTGALYFLSEVTGRSRQEVMEMLGFKVVAREDKDGKTYHTTVLQKGFDIKKVWANIVSLRDAGIASGRMLRREFPFYGDLNTTTIDQSDYFAKDLTELEEHFDWKIDEASSGGKFWSRYAVNMAGQKTLSTSRYNEITKVDETISKALQAIKDGKQVAIVAETVNEQTFPDVLQDGPHLERKVERPDGKLDIIPYTVREGAISQIVKKLTELGHGDKIAHLYGGASASVRVDREAFQDGTKPIALMTVGTAGTGIDLDDTVGNKPRHVLIMTKNFSADKFDQLLGRFSRRNSKAATTVEFLFNDREPDHIRNRTLEQKLTTLKAVQGGFDADIAAGGFNMDEKVESADSTDTMFKLSSEIEETKNLVALHNLNAVELAGVLEIGGFVMPSIAITKGIIGFGKFGNISVIFNKDTIDPRISKANRIYGSDAYTASFPTIHYDIDAYTARQIDKRVFDAIGNSNLYLDTDSIEREVRYFGGDIKAAYYDNEHIHKTYNVERKAKKTLMKYDEWFDTLFKGLVKGSGIRNNVDIFTPSGTRRSFKATHMPVTARNVLKQMLKSEKEGGEGFHFGFRSFAGRVAKQIPSIAVLQKEKGRIQKLSEEEFDDLEKTLSDEYMDLIADFIAKNGKGSIQDVSEWFTESIAATPSMIIARGNQRGEGFYTMDADTAAKLHDIAIKVRALPRSYFEAKPHRIVEPWEAVAFVVPKGTPKTLTDAIRKQGGKVYRYDGADNRTEVVNKAAQEQNAMFKLSQTDMFETFNDEERKQFRWAEPYIPRVEPVKEDGRMPPKAGERVVYDKIDGEHQYPGLYPVIPPVKLHDRFLYEYAPIRYRSADDRVNAITTFLENGERVKLNKEEIKHVKFVSDLIEDRVVALEGNLDEVEDETPPIASDALPYIDKTQDGVVFRPSVEQSYNMLFIDMLARRAPKLAQRLINEAFYKPSQQRQSSLDMAIENFDADGMVTLLHGEAHIETEGAVVLPPMSKEVAQQNAMFMLAGEKAKTAPSLVEAEAMEKAKAGKLNIWRKTGWWRGYDGRWRFEIDPSEIRWKDEVKSGKLGGVINAPKLFEAYPELEGVEVNITKQLKAGHGDYNHETMTIRIGDGSGDTVSKSILSHELQHWIQRNEGFIFGSNLEIESLLAKADLRLAIREMEKTVAWHEAEGKIEEAQYWHNHLVSMREHLERNAKMRGGINYLRVGGEAESRLVQYRLDMTPEQRKNTPPWVSMEKMLKEEGLLKDGQKVEDVLLGLDRQQAEQVQGEAQNAMFKLEDDPTILKKLNEGETVKGYRSMELIDGKLYPVMSTLTAKGELRDAEPIGKWVRAEEDPRGITWDKGRAYYNLRKAGRKITDITARYNPYLHVPLTPLNDQFKAAYKRDSMVTVEVEVPKSELTSGYKAEHAKDATGIAKWKSGDVTKQVSADGMRDVMLSRWAKIGRIIPNSEVAQLIKDYIGKVDVSIPANVLPPSLRAELDKIGVPVHDTKETMAHLDARFMLAEEERPYGTAPDSLMGFRKHEQSRGFGETNYKTAIGVRVTYDNGNSFIDAIDGVNASYAMERARRNWEGAKIELISPEELKQIDRDLYNEIVDSGKVLKGDTQSTSDARFKLSEDTGDYDQSGNYIFNKDKYRPAVVKYAQDTFGDRVAPNGRKVWQNFVRWFGNSQVVDAEGKPLVVYHGTADSSGYTAFKTPSFFTDDYMNADGYANGERIIDAFIKLENPYVFDAKGAKWNDLKSGMGKTTREVVSHIQSLGQGHDGVIFENINDNWADTEEPGEDRIFAVFSPNQIKSATGNVGDYSESADVMFKMSPEAEEMADIVKYITVAEGDKTKVFRVNPDGTTERLEANAAKVILGMNDAIRGRYDDGMLNEISNLKDRTLVDKIKEEYNVKATVGVNNKAAVVANRVVNAPENSTQAMLTAEETVGLNLYLNNLYHQTAEYLKMLEAAADLPTHFDATMEKLAEDTYLINQALLKAGTITSRAFSARKILLNQMLDRHYRISLAEKAKGQALTDQELIELNRSITEWQEKYAKLETEIAAHEAAANERDRMLAEKEAEIEATKKELIEARKTGTDVGTIVKAAWSQVLDENPLAEEDDVPALAKMVSERTGSTMEQAYSTLASFLDNDVMFRLGKFNVNLGADAKIRLARKLANRAQQEAAKERKISEQARDKAAKEYEKRGPAPKGAKGRLKLSELSEEQFNTLVTKRSARAAIRMAIRRAIEGNIKGTMGELVDTAMKMLEGTEYVNLGRREFMDIAIDYSRAREEDTRSDADIRESQLNSEILQRLRVLDLLDGIIPEQRGRHKTPTTTEMRDLMRQVRKLMKDVNIPEHMKERFIASANKAMQTRLLNTIEELKEAIKENKLLSRDKKEATKKHDDTIALEKQVEELRKIYNELAVVKADKEAAEIRKAENNLIQWQNKLKQAEQGIFPETDKREPSAITKEYREKVREIQKQIRELKKANLEEMAKRIEAIVEKADNTIAEIEKRIEEGEAQDTKPYKTDAERAEALAQETDEDRARREQRQMVRMALAREHEAWVAQNPVDAFQKQVTRELDSLYRRREKVAQQLTDKNYQKPSAKRPIHTPELYLARKQLMEMQAQLREEIKTAKLQAEGISGNVKMLYGRTNDVLRAIMASVDISFLGIQGAVVARTDLMFNRGKIVKQAWVEALQAVKDPAYVGEVLHKLLNNPTADLFIKHGGDINALANELYGGSYASMFVDKMTKLQGGFTAPIRMTGEVISASERHFIVMGAVMRVEMFSRLLSMAGEAELSEAELDLLANMVNVATGSAPSTSFGGAPRTLGKLMWAARLFASRLARLTGGNGLFYHVGQRRAGVLMDWKGFSPEYKKLVLRQHAEDLISLAVFSVVLKSMLGLLWRQEPEDEDELWRKIMLWIFGPSKIGNHQIDLTGGVWRMFNMFNRMFGFNAHTYSGKPAGSRDTAGAIFRMMRGTASPLIGVGFDMLGKDFLGEPYGPFAGWKGKNYPFDIGASVKGTLKIPGSVMPLSLQDAYEVMEEVISEGGTAESMLGAAIAMPFVFAGSGGGGAPRAKEYAWNRHKGIINKINRTEKEAHKTGNYAHVNKLKYDNAWNLRNHGQMERLYRQGMRQLEKGDKRLANTYFHEMDALWDTRND